MRRRVLDYGVAGTLVLCAALLFIANAKQPTSRNSLDRAVLHIAAPVERVVSWAVGGVGSLFNRYVWLREIDEENAELRTENERLRRVNAELSRRVADTAALEAMLRFEERVPAATLGARVIAGSLSPHYRLLRLRIDRGGDLVQAGMPVVTGAGLVGRIDAVYSNYSEVLLVTDPRSSIDVALPRSGGRGVVTGLARSDRYLCKLEQLDRSRAVEVGDEVVTSGLGGAFPAGIVVGLVSAVRSDPASLYQEVELAPAVDFSRFDSVMVMLTVPPPPGDAEAAPRLEPLATRVRGI